MSPTVSPCFTGFHDVSQPLLSDGSKHWTRRARGGAPTPGRTAGRHEAWTSTLAIVETECGPSPSRTVSTPRSYGSPLRGASVCGPNPPGAPPRQARKAARVRRHSAQGVPCGMWADVGDDHLKGRDGRYGPGVASVVSSSTAWVLRSHRGIRVGAARKAPRSNRSPPLSSNRARR